MERKFNGFDLTIINDNEMPADIDASIREGLAECFPHNAEHYRAMRPWHSIPEWVICLTDGNSNVVSHMAIVERTVKVGTERIPVTVAGLQGVFVRPQWRKNGFVDYMMGIMLEEAKNRGTDAGLLFCKPEIEQKVYGRFGWRKIDVNFILTDDKGVKSIRHPKDIGMAIPLNIDSFPCGDVDLNGMDW